MQKIHELLYDPEFRSRLRENPNACIKELYDGDYDESVEYVIVTSSNELFYIVVPYVNELLDLNELEDLNAAGASTAGSVGTGACLGTACTCFSSFSSAGSVGSAA